mmetsp:Transcript_25773/g.43000  ORF Transcript_25773/g.43000 Transcript_25773/m.43000 type:complete len:300 (-) Transcript_25773:169-1068(-)
MSRFFEVLYPRVSLSVLMILLLLLSLLLRTLTSSAGNVIGVNKRVMVWMCLEFCEETEMIIDTNLKQIDAHRDIISAASFEKYTLGPNSTLVDNNLTEVSSSIVAMGLEAWPLLSSYPHPPEFIDWMRDVFRDPLPFFESCIHEAQLHNYTGYNLDWEPTDGVTVDDGNDYAIFIDKFATSLHVAGLVLSVDVATWTDIWNYTAISASAVDRAISMGTYTSSDSSFSSQLDLLVTNFGPLRSGVGLETVNASTEQRMSLDEVSWRFQQIEMSGAMEVDLWKMPIPPLWWPLISDYFYRR